MSGRGHFPGLRGCRRALFSHQLQICLSARILLMGSHLLQHPVGGWANNMPFINFSLWRHLPISSEIAIGMGWFEGISIKFPFVNDCAGVWYPFIRRCWWEWMPSSPDNFEWVFNMAKVIVRVCFWFILLIAVLGNRYNFLSMLVDPTEQDGWSWKISHTIYMACCIESTI